MIDQLSIEVFARVSGFTFESEGVLDSFKSCIVNWRAYDYNTFQLDALITPHTIAYLTPDTILLINGCYFYIDRVNVDKLETGIITATGNSLFGKATKRIIVPPYITTSEKPDEIAWNLVNRHITSGAETGRQVGYLSLHAYQDLALSPVLYQNSYGVVAEEVNFLCLTYDFCFREVPTDLVNPTTEIQFFKGNDFSETVEFSAEFDNVKSEGFEHSVDDLSTVAYVFGEGEGSARKSVVVGNETGLERNELYVDARDIQQTTSDVNGNQTTLTNQQYADTLTQRGTQSLADRVEVLTLKGDINLNSTLFIYGVDYNVGDRVTITSETFNLSKSIVLSEMEEAWDDQGHHLTPTFGKDSPTLVQKLARN